MIEAGIALLLLGDARFTALTGSNLFPVLLPDDATVPAVAYQVSASESAYTLDGPGLTTATLQFDAWGQAYSDVAKLSDTVRLVLSGFRGSLPNGCNVLSMTRGAQVDSYEESSRRYCRRSTYRVQYQDTSAALSVATS